jgi:hypothetical protein
MADLRNNLVGSTVAGIIIGVTGAANKFIVNGMPIIYDAVVGSLGRWGEPVFAIAMGFVLDFASDRAQFLVQYRVPSRWFVYGMYRLIEEAFGMVQGRGFAYIAKDGSVKTDPADTITSVYMQRGDSVAEVRPGSRKPTIGPRRYVAVGSKRLYSFEAPYELGLA